MLKQTHLTNITKILLTCIILQHETVRKRNNESIQHYRFGTASCNHSWKYLAISPEHPALIYNDFWDSRDKPREKGNLWAWLVVRREVEFVVRSPSRLVGTKESTRRWLRFPEPGRVARAPPISRPAQLVHPKICNSAATAQMRASPRQSELQTPRQAALRPGTGKRGSAKEKSRGRRQCKKPLGRS